MRTGVWVAWIAGLALLGQLVVAYPGAAASGGASNAASSARAAAAPGHRVAVLGAVQRLDGNELLVSPLKPSLVAHGGGITSVSSSAAAGGGASAVVVWLTAATRLEVPGGRRGLVPGTGVIVGGTRSGDTLAADFVVAMAAVPALSRHNASFAAPLKVHPVVRAVTHRPLSEGASGTSISPYGGYSADASTVLQGSDGVPQASGTLPASGPFTFPLIPGWLSVGVQFNYSFSPGGVQWSVPLDFNVQAPSSDLNSLALTWENSSGESFDFSGTGAEVGANLFLETSTGTQYTLVAPSWGVQTQDTYNGPTLGEGETADTTVQSCPSVSPEWVAEAAGAEAAAAWVQDHLPIAVSVCFPATLQGDSFAADIAQGTAQKNVLLTAPGAFQNLTAVPDSNLSWDMTLNQFSYTPSFSEYVTAGISFSYSPSPNPLLPSAQAGPTLSLPKVSVAPNVFLAGGTFSPAQLDFTLNGFTPPPPSGSPVANFEMGVPSEMDYATAYQTLSATVPSGGTVGVEFDATSSTGPISGYDWYLNGSFASSAEKFTTALGAGTYAVKLCVYEAEAGGGNAVDCATGTLVLSVSSTGSLQVTVAGLPSGTPADVTVTGPDGYSQSLAQSRTLTGLTPGQYTVAAKGVTTSGGTTYEPTVGSYEGSAVVTVSQGQTASQAVVYSASSQGTGALDVAISGLGSSVLADVVVTGPNGFSWSLSESNAISDIAPGTYTVAAYAVNGPNGTGYAPTPGTQSVNVEAGATADASVSYAAGTGSLEVAISGLPQGVSPAVTVTDQATAQSQTLSAAQTLSGLAPGTYAVTAADVTRSGQTFTATVTGSPVTVAAGQTAQVTVAYALTSGTLKINVSGLPTGTAPSVSVSGPGGYEQAVTSLGSTTLDDLTPGSYAVSAQGVTVNGVEYYTASVQGSPANVVAGQSAAVGVVYGLSSCSGAAAPVGFPVVTGVSPATGSDSGGTQVTITGSGFDHLQSVDFGPFQASILSHTSTQIVVDSPMGPASQQGAWPVDVTVTTSTGTSAASPCDQFDYTFQNTFTTAPAPTTAPTVTAVSVSQGSTLGGTQVTITGQNFCVDSGTQNTCYPTPQVTFGWINATANGQPVLGQSQQANPATVESFTPTKITVLSPPSPDVPTAQATVDIEVFNAWSWSAPTPTDRFTYVPPTPVPPQILSVSPDFGSVAGGETVTIQGQNFIPGDTQVAFGDVCASSWFGSCQSTVTVPDSAPVEKVTPTEIVVREPTGQAGTVDVAVTTPYGTSPATVADEFTFLSSLQTPTVTGVTPSQGPVQGGNTVTVYGTNFVPGNTQVCFGSQINYTGPAAGGFNQTAQVSCNQATQVEVSPDGTSLQAVAPASPGPPDSAMQVQVQVVTPAGESAQGSAAGGQADLYTYAGTAAQSPVITGFTPTSGPFAGGEQVTITGNNFWDLLTGAAAWDTCNSPGPVATFTVEVSSCGVPAVTFDGVPAQVLTFNDTTIQVVAPFVGASTGSGNQVAATITVRTHAGAVTSAQPFMYGTPPLQVTQVGPHSGPESGGVPVTITGTGWAGTSSSGTYCAYSAGSSLYSGPRYTCLDQRIVFTGQPTAVYFGTTPASSFTLAPDGAITAVAPPGEGTDPISVRATVEGEVYTSTTTRFGMTIVYVQQYTWQTDATSAPGCDQYGCNNAGFTYVPPGSAVTVAVPPVQRWSDSGVALTAGRAVAILGAGLVDYDVGLTAEGVNATRAPGGGMSPTCPQPAPNVTGAVPATDAPCFALVGRIGSGPPFDIGWGTSFVPAASGELYLADNFCWSPCPDRASGQFTATIVQYAPGVQGSTTTASGQNSLPDVPSPVPLTASATQDQVQVTPAAGALSGLSLVLTAPDPSAAGQVAQSVYGTVYASSAAVDLLNTYGSYGGVLATTAPTVLQRIVFIGPVVDFATAGTAKTLFGNEQNPDANPAIKVTLPYDAAALPPGSTPQVVWLDTSSSPAAWTNAGVEVLGVGRGTITAYLPHLSTYTVVALSAQSAQAIRVTATPNSLPADGTSAATLTATVLDASGNPVPGVQVTFDTTIGTLSPTTAVTDSSGQASVELTSSQSGTAQVTASAAGIASAPVSVAFATATAGTPVAAFVFHPSPIAPAGSLPPGALAVVLVTAEDASGAAVPGATIDLSFVPAPGGGTAEVGSTELGASAQAFTTDANGQVTVVYIGPATPPASGADVITASVPGSPAATATDSYAFAGVGVTVSAAPGQVPADGTSSATITARVTQGANPVAGAEVQFTTDLGRLSSASAVTNAAGTAQVTWTSTQVGQGQVTVTADGATGTATVDFTAVSASAAAPTTTYPSTGASAPGVTAPVSSSGASPSGVSSAPATTRTFASGVVNAAGATVATAGNAMVLEIPPGTLPPGVTVTVRALRATHAAVPRGFVLASPEWRLTASGSAGIKGTLRAVFRYARAALDGRSPLRLAVWALDARGGWTWIGGRVNPAHATVTVRLAHLGTYAVLASVTVFGDLDRAPWARDAVDTLLSAGLVAGVGHGAFDPQGPVTRAQFATLLAKVDGLVPAASASIPFRDVPGTAWYAPYVAAAARAGLVAGVGGGRFDPGGKLTRVQMAVMLARLLHGAASGVSLTRFADAASIPSWARSSVREVLGAGLMRGLPHGVFAPGGLATRADAAAAIARYLAYTGKT